MLVLVNKYPNPDIDKINLSNFENKAKIDEIKLAFGEALRITLGLNSLTIFKILKNAIKSNIKFNLLRVIKLNVI